MSEDPELDRGGGESGGARQHRRTVGQVFAEIHYRLRTEGGSPRERATAIWLGTAIGCLPLYGLHLVLCLVFARLLRVNRVLTYLAAHINNQFTAPFLIVTEYAVGHRMVQGRWPELDWGSLRSASPLELGRDLLLGSVVVGVVLGLLLAAVTLVVGARWRRAPLEIRLREETSKRYTESGIFSWEFVRGKLRHDPLYFGVLRSGVLPSRGRIVDLGCGRGIFLALLACATELQQNDDWSEEWPSPPMPTSLIGVEGRPDHADIARRAVPEAHIETADLTAGTTPEGDVILLFDVLHYLGREEQERLLAAVTRTLVPGGLLLIREADRDAGLRFLLTRIQERLASIGRGAWRQRFYYRGTSEWRRLLEAVGLGTESAPMAAGTPFSNDLIVARKGSDTG